MHILLLSALAVWYFFIHAFHLFGLVKIWLEYKAKPPPARSPDLPAEQEPPHITIIRPVKGLEPYLYECLAATFRQSYPHTRLTIYLCVSTRQDPAFPILQRLLRDFPGFDAQVLIEEEDPALRDDGTKLAKLGPNPKIRNMSRAYREAKGDVIWILDCNVWIGKGVAGRLVDRLYGLSSRGRARKPCKFVHQLPIVVDSSQGDSLHSLVRTWSILRDRILTMAGGRLEEMFMSTAHAKSYTTINSAAIAPCTLGKSSMFRRSDLDFLTNDPESRHSPGIDCFSDNICEDHLIGDILWKQTTPAELAGSAYIKHGMVLGDLVIQPMHNMSLTDYWARRVRWIRVRKWTVILATLVEPHIECLLLSIYGTFLWSHFTWFGRSTALLGTSLTWLTVYILQILEWMAIDHTTYTILQSAATVELDEHTPAFARPQHRAKMEWLLAWWGRELLAFPIWAWAFMAGTTVTWRGKTFYVGRDMKVREIRDRAGTDDREVLQARKGV